MRSTEEEVIKACKDANIWTFVESLPEGLDTEVGGKVSAYEAYSCLLLDADLAYL